MEDNTSNNEAEYQALILGLQSLKDNGWECEPTLVMSDSQLVVRQLAGEYEVSAVNLVPLYLKCKALLSDFPKYKIEHTMREGNKRADALANWAMDNLQPDGGAVTKGMAWEGRPPPMFTSSEQVQRAMQPRRTGPDGAPDRGQRMNFIRAATGAKQSTVVDTRMHIRRGGARRLKYLDEKEAELKQVLRDHAGSITQGSEFARAASKALARLTLLRLAVREAEKLITPEHGAAHPRETDGPGGAWLCRMEEIFPRALDEDGLAKVMATRRDQIRDIMRDERTLTAQMVQTFRLHLKVIEAIVPQGGERLDLDEETGRRGGALETPTPQAHQNSAGGWGR